MLLEKASSPPVPLLKLCQKPKWNSFFLLMEQPRPWVCVGQCNSISKLKRSCAQFFFFFLKKERNTVRDSINRKKSYKTMPTFSLIYKKEDWFIWGGGAPLLRPRPGVKECLYQQPELKRKRDAEMAKLKKWRNRDGHIEQKEDRVGSLAVCLCLPHTGWRSAWFLSCVSSY